MLPHLLQAGIDDAAKAAGLAAGHLESSAEVVAQKVGNCSRFVVAFNRRKNANVGRNEGRAMMRTGMYAAQCCLCPISQ